MKCRYGQMTAGSYVYIGPQGIVHGTTVSNLPIRFLCPRHSTVFNRFLNSWPCWTLAANIWDCTTYLAKFSWHLVWVGWAERKPKRPPFADASGSLPRFTLPSLFSLCFNIRVFAISSPNDSRTLIVSAGQLRGVKKALRSRLGPGNDWRRRTAGGTRQSGSPKQRSTSTCAVAMHARLVKSNNRNRSSYWLWITREFGLSFVVIHRRLASDSTATSSSSGSDWLKNTTRRANCWSTSDRIRPLATIHTLVDTIPSDWRIKSLKK